MDEILKFAQGASQLSIIAILSIVIYQLVKGQNVMEAFTLRKKDPLPAPTSVESFIPESTLIIQKLDKIAGNHLHDLPGMRQDMTKMMETLTDIQKEQNKQGRQLVRLETTLKLPPMP